MKGGGAGGTPGGFGGGFTFTSSDPRDIFAQFFGSGTNPFDDMFSGAGGPGPGGFTFNGSTGGFTDFSSFSNRSGGGGFGGMGKRQDPPVEHKLNVTLDELYHGCTKKMKISRKVMQADGTTSKQDKIVSVDIKSGWKAGTKVTFAREGDQVAGKIPSDVVFVIGEKPHHHFTREGNNLRHKAKVTLKTALCGGEVTIPTINGSKPIKHKLNRVVDSNTEEVFPEQGMPISKQPGKRGDLLINYNILFPKGISPQDKKTIETILQHYQ